MAQILYLACISFTEHVFFGILKRINLHGIFMPLSGMNVESYFIIAWASNSTCTFTSNLHFLICKALFLQKRLSICQGTFLDIWIL